MAQEEKDMSKGAGAQYREGICAAVIGIIIEGVNAIFFKNSGEGTLLAVAIALIGLLLTITRFALQTFFKETFTKVEAMAKIIDLSVHTKTDLVKDLLDAYIRVTEEEFREVKEHIVTEASEKLRRLSTEKRSPTLQTTDYYSWLFRQFDDNRLGEGDYIHAVSLASDTEWNDSQEEKNFLDKNIAAAQRGVEVARIFIAKESDLPHLLSLPPIDLHTVEVDNKLDGYYVSREHLEKSDRDFLASIGEGFIDFNGRVALEDRFDQIGRVRGEVTLHRGDLHKMKSIFEKLKYMAKPLRINLAHAAALHTNLT